MSFDRIPSTLDGYTQTQAGFGDGKAKDDVGHRRAKSKVKPNIPDYRYDAIRRVESGEDPVNVVIDEITGTIGIGDQGTLAGGRKRKKYVHAIFPEEAMYEFIPTRHDLDRHVGKFVVLAQSDRNSNFLQPMHYTHSPSEASHHAEHLYRTKNMYTQVVMPRGGGRYEVLLDYGELK